MKRILLFIIVAFHIVFPKEDFLFRNYSINEGLSQSTVISIVQDNRGYLWFGTQYGLNRFDGYQFQSYYYNTSDSNSICSNNINFLLSDRTGELWIGTDKGLNYYNSKKNTFIRYQVRSDSKIDNPQNIKTIFDKSNAELLIGTSDGLFLFSKRNKSFKRINIESVIRQARIKINSIHLIKGNYWIATDKGILKLSLDLVKAKLIQIKKDVKDIIEVSSLLLYKEKILAGCFPGIYEIDIETEKIFKLSKDFPNAQELHVRELIKDSLNRIWIATWSGLFIVEDGFSNIQKYVTENKEGSLNDNAINKVYFDNAGIVWIGTSFGGVNYLYPKHKNFNILRTAISSIKSPNKNIVSGIEVWGDYVIYGTVGEGIIFYDRNTKQYMNLREENGLLSNLIRTLYIENGKLWVGYWANGITSIELQNFSIKNYLPPNSNKSHNESSVVSLIKNEKYLLLGTSNSGLIIFDLVKNTFIHSGFIYSTINCFEKNDNFIYLGTSSGVYRINLTKKIKDFEHLERAELFLKDINVLSIKSIGNDTLIIGTNGSGLIILDIKNNKSNAIKTGSGLSNDVINSIAVCDKNIWASTNKGISRINLDSYRVQNYYSEDGLSGNEFNKGSVAITPENEVFFGGITGVTYFKPEEIHYNKYQPNLYLSEVKLLNDNISFLNNEVIDGDYYNIREIRIPYEKSLVSFKFSALNFIFPQKNEYSYIIEGKYEEWVNLGNQRVVSIASLDPGEYLLKVRCKNNDGVLSEKVLAFNLVIIPPFYMTLWFKLLIAIIILISFYLAYKVRINYLIGLEKIRVKIASDLHDDIGSSLTKITLNAGLGLYEESLEKVKSRLKKIEEMSREIVSNMSDIIWTIDARKDYIGDLVNKMKDYSFLISEISGIKIGFKESGLDIEKRINAEIRQNIYLIFKESINNAVKYSGSSTIDVLLFNDKKSFILTIKDYGRGLNKENKLGGNGLRNMQDRAKILKGEIVYLSRDGFEVKLKLPPI